MSPFLFLRNFGKTINYIFEALDGAEVAAGRFEGLNGRLTLHVARQRHSFCDSRRSDGTNLIGQSEKQVGIPHFTKNFHDAFILPVPVFSTAGAPAAVKRFRAPVRSASALTSRLTKQRYKTLNRGRRSRL
jgi:hypothetical protein